MSSVFVTEGKDVKGFLGKRIKVPYYLQFVPGYVVDVVHSEESFEWAGENTINTIIALPHYSDKVFKTRATIGEKYRYFPLLRTMHDVPSKGDPVLLCTIGKINYYLGPLNTLNNSPTWNDDPSFNKEILTETKMGVSEESLSNRGLRGESLNFDKRTTYKRLTKRHKPQLELNNSIFETTGDTILEGRHGNSVRIGSRSVNPYIFISNQRMSNNEEESLADGSLISITADGTIADHFDGFGIDNGNDVELVNGFTLASDSDEENTYPIGEIFTSVNGFSDNSPIYNYNGNQMLFHSDKITLNTKLDDIFISSKKDIHIGSSRYTTISSGNSMIVNTTDFNIGDPQVAEMQPLVLGNTLKEVLTDIVGLFSKIQIATQLGPQNILPTTQVDIQSVTNKIESIVSSFHKIEEG